MRRTLLAVSVFAVVHMGAALWVGIEEFGAVMARFDEGPTQAGPAEQVFHVAGLILNFPLVSAALAIPLSFPGPWGFIPFAANSLLWGAAAVWLWRRTRRPAVV